MIHLDIVHRYGAKRHYQPLTHLSEHSSRFQTSFYEFTFLNSPLRAALNAVYLANIATGRIHDRTIILGAEPFDIRLPLFRRFAKYNDIIYHTSWPFWNGERVPRSPLVSGQRDAWREFLQNVEIVTVSKAAVTSLQEFGVGATHIPHSVDCERFSPENKSEDRSEGITVLFVGRLEPRKGVDDLIKIAQQNTNESVQFRFVGDGPLAEEVSEAAQGPSAIRYDGYISDSKELAEIYASADVFVLPSKKDDEWEELFGIVLIEAMASGLPVIATECVGPREIVEDGETGYLVPIADRTALRTRIKELVDSPERREQMGIAARSKALERFDVERVSQQWEELIQKIQ